MLYHPTNLKYFDPQKAGATPEDVWFVNNEKINLHGWYFHNALKIPPKALIVFFHGNGENLTSHFATLLWILNQGYDYFIFDYQGYGESQGKPSPQGTVDDGKAALLWANAHRGGAPLVVFAQSLGGAVAMRSVIEIKDVVPIQLVVVDSTFSSYKEAARSILRRSWVTWILQPVTYFALSDSFAPDNQINKIAPIPMVVMHGTKDQIIDFSLGKEVFELAGEPKEFWTIDDGYHTDGFWRHGTTYRQMFLDRLAKLDRKGPK